VASRVTITEKLVRCRARLDRLTPLEAWQALDSGAVLVDIRSADQRRVGGVIPRSIWFPRNVLEWRVDPSSGSSDPAVDDPSRRIILLCAEGFQTSLAAAGLHDLGFSQATDVIDGFVGWVGAGLPVVAFRDDQHLLEGSCRRESGPRR
jgi:rhodanese-related sulfurtransferase